MAEALKTDRDGKVCRHRTGAPQSSGRKDVFRRLRLARRGVETLPAPSPSGGGALYIGSRFRSSATPNINGSSHSAKGIRPGLQYGNGGLKTMGLDLVTGPPQVRSPLAPSPFVAEVSFFVACQSRLPG